MRSEQLLDEMLRPQTGHKPESNSVSDLRMISMIMWRSGGGTENIFNKSQTGDMKFIKRQREDLTYPMDMMKDKYAFVI